MVILLITRENSMASRFGYFSQLYSRPADSSLGTLLGKQDIYMSHNRFFNSPSLNLQETILLFAFAIGLEKVLAQNQTHSENDYWSEEIIGMPRPAFIATAIGGSMLIASLLLLCWYAGKRMYDQRPVDDEERLLVKKPSGSNPS